MSLPFEGQSPLPADRAFVVQLHAEAEAGRRHWRGRVEHVRSARATHFHMLEELLGFMARVLADVSTEPAGGSGGNPP